MPLIGKWWSAEDVRATIEEMRIPLEMPEIPFEREYARFGRAHVVTVVNRYEPSKSLAMFWEASVSCDLYRTTWELPYALRSNDKGGLQADYLLQAARYRCIWTHWETMLRLAADYALLVMVASSGVRQAESGQVGSTRWDRVRDGLLAHILTLASHRLKAQSMAVFLRLCTEYIAHSAVLDAPGDSHRERVLRLFDQDVDPRALSTHDLCSCGCGIRLPLN